MKGAMRGTMGGTTRSAMGGTMGAIAACTHDIEVIESVGRKAKPHVAKENILLDESPVQRVRTECGGGCCGE